MSAIAPETADAAGIPAPIGPVRRFAFLSFRPFANDFRRYLMRALQEAGYPCAHVLLKRREMEMRTGPALEVVTRVSGLGELTRRVTDFLQPDRRNAKGVVVNSAGNSAPDVILRLRAGLRAPIWIYDVYDQLRYDARGAKRLQWWLTDKAYRWTATGCCLLSAELQPDYASAFHLDNASHLTPSRSPGAYGQRIVVTASFDRRTDFALLEAIAREMPEVTIDLHGAVYDNEPEITAAIARLTASYRNVRYFGRFDMEQIGALLDDYAVGLVPYRTESVMTRFINPDKLFHYLCAGLEVIASPIPAIRRFAPYVYEAADASAVAAALCRVRAGEHRNPGNLHQSLNWHIRAQELVGFVERLATESATFTLKGSKCGGH